MFSNFMKEPPLKITTNVEWGQHNESHVLGSLFIYINGELQSVISISMEKGVLFLDVIGYQSFINGVVFLYEIDRDTVRNKLDMSLGIMLSMYRQQWMHDYGHTFLQDYGYGGLN